jgi:hypothetical protein
MNKLILTAVLTICMVGVVHADMYDFTFTFDDVSLGAGAGAIETYMEGIYLSDITVLGSPTITDATPLGIPLGSDLWVIANGETGGAGDWVSFTFTTPITSVSFDWARTQNDFFAQANTMTLPFFSSTGSHGNDVYTGNTTFDFLSDPLLLERGPVTILTFHNGGSGWIGIDNLSVRAVPVPAAVLLGIIGLGVAGWKLRKYA